jgi:hypothetical protein
VATPACGLRCTTQDCETFCVLRCSRKCPVEGGGGAGGPRRRRVPRRLGDWPTRETTSESPGCWARKGAQYRGGSRRARPSPAWARRHRRGGGAGDLSRAGMRERVSDDVRGGVHARQVTTTAVRRLAATEASRRGSRRSPARRHGRRRARRPRSVHESASGFTAVAGRVQGGQGHGALFPSLSVTVYEALGHGEAAAMRTGLTRRRRPTQEERGQGPTWPPGSTRARAGVHGGAGRQVRKATRANASADGSALCRGREQQRTTLNQRQGKARPRERRALTKAAAPANVLS